MSKRKSFFIGFATACVLIVLIYNIRTGVQLLSGNLSEERKIKVIENLIDEHFVDDVDQEELKEYIYAGYIAGLGDKYSTYMTAEQFEAFKESLSGAYSGIGITISLSTNGKMTVTEVYGGSPADSAGILSGDTILSINGTEITDKDSYLEAVKFIKGSTEPFILKGEHQNGEAYEAEIAAEDIDIPSVCYSLFDGNIGYIRITEFDGNTAEQFEEALEELGDIEGLVIDLRNNPGGYLTTVNKIADRILPEGTITYMEYKDGEKKYYKSDENCLDIPIAVLVNGNSASASEVLTGAIKDYGVGTIVGTTTYGKGVVQESYTLSDGSCVKLTVAKYYTPSGVCINGTGIDPDIEVFAPESFKLSSVTDSDAVTDLENDTQLKKALEILK
ncbi:MAG: S41 family peptidase [Clostridiales bacterium]|nr:S41 family peptidase [Clostridiales bacterium]